MDHYFGFRSIEGIGGMLAEFDGPMLKAVRLTRRDVFGEFDKQHPISEPEDAAVPQIGFVGRNYRVGGTILLGINPGGDEINLLFFLQ